MGPPRRIYFRALPLLFEGPLPLPHYLAGEGEGPLFRLLPRQGDRPHRVVLSLLPIGRLPNKWNTGLRIGAHKILG